MNIFKKKYFESKYDYIFAELIKHLPYVGKVLDVGCGNLELAKMLHLTTELSVTGIDVIDNLEKNENVRFIKYDGKTIPFEKNSFDVSYAVFVLHHSLKPEKLFQEMVRVTRKKIIIFEPVYENWLELQFLKLFDLTNLFDSLAIPLPFSFKTTPNWKEIFANYSKKITTISLPKTYRPFAIKAFVIKLDKG